METLTIPVSSLLKNELETCLHELNITWEEFLEGSLHTFIKNKRLEAGFDEYKKMEETGDFGKGYTVIDLLMKDLLS